MDTQREKTLQELLQRREIARERQEQLNACFAERLETEKREYGTHNKQS